MSAALYMVRIQALVHLLIKKLHPSPKELFLELNNYVKSEQDVTSTFVTACAAFFPNGENHLSFQRAGHNIPIIFSKKHDSHFQAENRRFCTWNDLHPDHWPKLRKRNTSLNRATAFCFTPTALSKLRDEKRMSTVKTGLTECCRSTDHSRQKLSHRKYSHPSSCLLVMKNRFDDITFTTIHKNEPPKSLTEK
jgi:hypothetical protein